MWQFLPSPRYRSTSNNRGIDGDGEEDLSRKSLSQFNKVVVCLLSVALIYFLYLPAYLPTYLPSSKSLRSRSCHAPPSIDYLEIGTSDFGTIVQAVDLLVTTEGWLSEPLRGVSVDAMKIYLDRLPPQEEHRRYLNYAVTGVMPHSASLPVYYIDPVDIVNQGFHDFLKGCNRVGEPHPLAIETLSNWKSKDVTKEFLKMTDVPVISIPELILVAGACRVGALKIDVEGLDADLILSYVAFLWANPQCRADLVLFEERNLGRKGLPATAYTNMFKAAGAALSGVGYNPAFNPLDKNGYIMRDAVWVWSAARDSRLWAARAALGSEPTVTAHTAGSVAEWLSRSKLGEEQLDALLLRGSGGTLSDEGIIGADEADELFNKFCTISVPLPAPGMVQGRQANSTAWLRTILTQ